MTIGMVAVLAAKVPVVFEPVALTGGPLAGATLTVIGVLSGRFTQLTTTGTGLFCWAATTASGVPNWPVGGAETGTPPTAVTVNCAPRPATGMITNWEPLV